MDPDPLKDVLHQPVAFAMEYRDYEATPNTLKGRLVRNIKQIERNKKNMSH